MSTQLDDDADAITTLDEYNRVTRQLAELETRAEHIANILCSRSASFLTFQPDTVVYEYNKSCNCHPEEKAATKKETNDRAEYVRLKQKYGPPDEE